MLGRPLVTYDDVPSTMDIAASFGRGGAPEGTCIVARHQSAGRGRDGRQWHTPPGTALLCSVLLRPRVPLSALTPMSILAADAIAQAIAPMCGVHPTIKWPNDVLVGGRKLSGVLIQTFNDAGGPVMIVGMGVNANVSVEQLAESATSLLAESGKPVNLDRLRRDVLRGLELRYDALCNGPLDQFWPAVESRLAMRGERVSVLDAGRELTGTIEGIAADGALVLDTGNRVLHVASGDLVRGPRILRRS